MTQAVRRCYAVLLGRVDYSDALQLQLRICELKKAGFVPDVLLLLEHPPTITLGRSGKWSNLIVSDQILNARGVRRFEVDRGGDITFHGPGQLVGYPLLRLERTEQDVRRYMRNLEECLIRLLGGFGIAACRNENYTGVWTDCGKIAAMGVHISRWITRHGFALNVNTDLSFYDLIVPCGISGKGVTSMEMLLSQQFELGCIAERFACEFAEVFARQVLWTSQSDLETELHRYAREISVA